MGAVDWNSVLSELKMFCSNRCRLEDLSDLTLDTLHGSMWGLNHRYKTLRQTLAEDGPNVLAYSIQRIARLVDGEPLGFRPRPLPAQRCMGFGTYGWKYDAGLILVAIEAGLWIDTAEGYGFGRVETELGKVFQHFPDKVHVATKASRSHMSEGALVAAGKRSRDKLQQVPHYQIHFPHARRTDEELGKALVSLRRSGTIRSFGLGNCSVDMIESMQRFLSDYSGDVITSVQVRYNLADRRIEGALLPYCQERGILIIAYSPLGQDFRTLCTLALEDVAYHSGCTPSQAALAWLYHRRGVIPIPRTNNMVHLAQNIDAREVELSKDAIEVLNRTYPYERSAS